MNFKKGGWGEDSSTYCSLLKHNRLGMVNEGEANAYEIADICYKQGDF
ncbi:MAG: hypothetical protein QXW79_03735 [Thermoplasmata archaeon]